jgi:RNA polymerase sigma-70 factor (ECF subfamily)
LDDPEAFQAWVGTIAVRLCHRRLRRRKIVAFLGFGDQTADDFTDERVALAWRPDRTLELGALERQLQKLAAPERTAWLLRYVEGETLEAVAALCHCSLATAKRWIRSANDSLKEVVPDVSDL